NNGAGKSLFPLEPLNISDACFPENKVTDYKNISHTEASQEYCRLWKGISEQLKNLPTDSAKGFLDSLQGLLQKFAWCIPASTNDLAHVSLYEHLKTTAAFAIALYDFKESTNSNIQDIKANDDLLPLILSCWDISGIQR